MATYDLTEFLEDDSIVLEGIRSEKFLDGKAYRFMSPDAKTGLWLKNLMELGMRANLGVKSSEVDLAKLTLDDDEERELYVRVMGATLEEMLADKVSWQRVQKVFGLLLRHYGAGQDIASTVAGEAAARPNRATRRATARKTGGSSSSRASGATPARTRSQASTRSSRTSAKPRAKAAG